MNDRKQRAAQAGRMGYGSRLKEHQLPMSCCNPLLRS